MPTVAVSLSSPEPMSPGSPVSGPTSPYGSSAQYLPGFLLGDQIPVSPSPRLWSQAASPSKTKTPLSALSPSNDAQPRRVTFSPLPPTSRIINNRSNSKKHGGPPTQGMFDHISNSASRMSLSQMNESGMRNNQSGVANVPLILDESQANLNASYYGTNVPLIPDESRDGSRLSNSVKENVGTWVTIYGFPPAAASYLLQKFSQYGTVCKYEISENGNWMHVCYQSKLEAKKAISKNGKIIGGSIMVGVKLCDDETVTGMSERDVSSSTSNISLLKDSGVDRTKNSFNRSSSMRPLTQAYKASTIDYEVKFHCSNPQKNNSLVTKAMEYVFGW